MKKTAIIIILLILVIKGFTQADAYKLNHSNFKSAIELLQQTKLILSADSILFDRELHRVKSEYKAFADSLKKHTASSIYFDFETQRLINLCYSARNIQELKKYQDKLFDYLGKYHKQVQEKDPLNEKIAKCLVNSYESQSIRFEDSLLNHVTKAIEKHMQSLQFLTWLPSQKQEFVNMYAAQYYKRGIVSMAEPVFRHFRDFYSQNSETEIKHPRFSEDYKLLSAKLNPTGKDLRHLGEKRIGIIATSESPFHLIYLITQLRTANEAYPNTPVCIFRDPSKVSDGYLLALKRNLAFGGYYIINLNNEDSKNTENFPCCYFSSEGGDLAFSTSNIIDFLEWLEKPLSEIKKKRKKQLRANYEKIQAQKDSIANLPDDNSIKYSFINENLSVDFKGYWNTKPKIKTKYYFFTETSYDNIDDSLQMAQFEVTIKETPVFILDFFPAGDTTKIILAADPYHNIKVSFKDTLNQQWYNASTSLDSLYYHDKAYSNIIENYPFKKTEFIDSINKRHETAKKQIQNKLNFSNKSVRSLLILKDNINNLSKTTPDTALSHEDLETHFPLQKFDSVIWKSPYYKTWLDSWLIYGSQDLKKCIDLLYSSWKIIPEAANTTVGEYLWDKMNSMGKFDMMVHLDTTWLAGCSDIKDVDVMKRVKGYKRMTPGKKAPNIRWEENGKKMDLYSIEADTSIVLFWSDGCKHCMESLPEMYSKLSTRKNIEVVAISVDRDESSLSVGKKHMPDWHHVWAKQAWESELIELYNIFGTPEMYLLDQDHKILKKQINYQ